MKDRDALLRAMLNADQAAVLCAIGDYLRIQADHYSATPPEPDRSAQWVVSESSYLVVQLSASGKKEPSFDPTIEDYRLKDGSAIRIVNRYQTRGRMALEEL